MPFTVTTLPVKMRLERSAERDKREYNNISADIAKANASAILNRPAAERIHMQEQAVFTQKQSLYRQPVAFAPSPSGRLHLGNLACSLLAWLSARSRGGRIVLRIEDLDAERCPRLYADLLEQDLDWLGLVWDEGGSTGGPNGPYYQSECAEIYASSFRKLEDRGLVYPCFCSRAQLHAASAPHTSDGNVIYPGTCRGLTAAEIAEKRKKKAPAYRLMVPDEEITFVDGCMGPHTENLLRDCGDFYLRRADGVFAYQLAVVVDDARMGVTEVVRGSDLLSSTARQLYLYHLLGLQAPGFAHCPLLLAPDGRRLSKRDGDQSLENLRTKYTAQEIVGKLAYAYGLQPEPAPRTPESLIGEFSWAKVPKQDVCLPEGCLKKKESAVIDGALFAYQFHRICGTSLRSSERVNRASSASASKAPSATSMQLCCLSSTVEHTMEVHSTAAAGRIQRRRGCSKNAAAVIRQQQRHRVEHMDGRAHVGGGYRCGTASARCGQKSRCPARNRAAGQGRWEG